MSISLSVFFIFFLKMFFFLYQFCHQFDDLYELQLRLSNLGHCGLTFWFLWFSFIYFVVPFILKILSLNIFVRKKICALSLKFINFKCLPVHFGFLPWKIFLLPFIFLLSLLMFFFNLIFSLVLQYLIQNYYIHLRKS